MGFCLPVAVFNSGLLWQCLEAVTHLISLAVEGSSRNTRQTLLKLSWFVGLFGFGTSLLVSYYSWKELGLVS